MPRRLVGTGLITCLVAVLTLAVPSSSVAATSLSLSRSTVIGGESIKVTGTTGVKVARPVVLQRKYGTSWLKVSSGKTTSTGSFAFTYKPPTTVGSTRTLRVQAPKVTLNGRTYLTVTTGSKTVTTVAQTAAAAAPTTAVQGEDFAVTGTFTPKRTGRVTAVQWWSGSAWATLEQGTQNIYGKTVFTVSLSELGANQLRVLTAAAAGAPAKASAAVTVTVSAPDPPDETPPPVPTDLIAASGDASVALSWAAVSADDLAGYFVYRATPSVAGPYVKVTPSPIVPSSYFDSSVTNETQYFYRVTSVDVNGNESEMSAGISAFPTAPPG